MNCGCFVVLSLSVCDIVMSPSANRSVDRFGDGCSNLKVLLVYDLRGTSGGDARALGDPVPSPNPSKTATIDAATTADPRGVPPSLNGLIAFLSRQCGGKVYRWELVEITENRNCHAVKNATDLARDSVFQWADPFALSVHFDFKTMKVIPASNAIRADSAGKNHLKSWVVEAW
jgi:hypothetical protein